MITKDGLGNGYTCDCDQCEAPMMDQWHLPYSDRSGSGCISEFENSSDEREHEAYLEWTNDRATPAEQAVPQTSASGEEDLSALTNITITSL